MWMLLCCSFKIRRRWFISVVQTIALCRANHAAIVCFNSDSESSLSCSSHSQITASLPFVCFGRGRCVCERHLGLWDAREPAALSSMATGERGAALVPSEGLFCYFWGRRTQPFVYGNTVSEPLSSASRFLAPLLKQRTNLCSTSASGREKS